MHTDNKSVAGLIGDLFESIGHLVHQELELVRVESTEKASEATIGLLGILGGMLVALASLLVLVQALVVTLARYMPADIAALVVGVGLALIAFILIRVGRSRLEAKSLALPKTTASLKRDKEMVMETVR